MVAPICGFARQDSNRCERLVCKDADEYFRFIGADDPVVLEVSQLPGSCDLDGLATHWKRFDKRFRELEQGAGHTGDRSSWTMT